MFPVEVTSSASTSSPLLSAKPTSEPSKYTAQVPAVVLPKEVGVNASTSSSLPLVSPGTDGLPVVENNNRPSDSNESESMLSPLVSKPTSLPSKYILKVPAVVLPRDVASKRSTSCGVAVMPLTVTEVVNDINKESESSMAKAKRSEPPTPTSEPSKNKDQFLPSNLRISSSAEETPPIVWLPVKDR